MCFRVVLLLLFLVREWNVTEADCSKKLTSNAGGVTFSDCPSTDHTEESRVSGKSTGTNIMCEQTYVFQGKPCEWFNVPDDVEFIAIVGIDIPKCATVTIENIVDTEDNCKILKLNRGANGVEKVIIKVNPSEKKFKIRTTNPSSTIKFTCNKDRDCAKMKMQGNGGLLRRMVDGEEAIANEYPFIVRLSIFYSTHNDPNDYKNCNTNGWVSYTDTKINCCNNSTLESYRCGGSILNKDWIMSAKHCFDKTDTSNKELFYLVGVLVYAGDHNTDVTETNKETLHWVTTDQIKKHKTADLALLKVVPEITLVKDCRYPICLPPSYMDKLPFLDGCAVEAAGWGLTEEGSLSDVLIKGNFTVVTNAACKTKYAEKSKVITNKMICTDHHQTISCKGDSGGPVFCKSWSKHYYQIGVISFGEPKTTDPLVWDNEFPDVNVRVTKFVDWIKGIVGNVP